MISVVGIVLIDQHRLLLERRFETATSYAGMWDTPGGKVEPGETPRIAIQRELREELGIHVVPRELGLLEDVEPTSGTAYLHHVFFARAEHHRPVAREGQELAWISLAELTRLERVNPIVKRSLELLRPARPSLLVTGARSVLGRHVISAWIQVFPDSIVYGVGDGPQRHDVFAGEILFEGVVVPPPVTDDVLDEHAVRQLHYLSADPRDPLAVANVIRDTRPTHILDLNAIEVGVEPALAAGHAVTRALSIVAAVGDCGHLGSHVVFVSSLEDQGIEAADEGLREPPRSLGPSAILASDSLDHFLTELGGGAARVSHARIGHVIGPGLSRATAFGRAVEWALATNTEAGVVEGANAIHVRHLVEVREVARRLVEIAASEGAGTARVAHTGDSVSLGAVALQLRSLATMPRGERSPAASPLEAALHGVVDYYRDRIAPAALRARARWQRGPSHEVAPSDATVQRVEVVAARSYEVATVPGIFAEIPKMVRERFGSTRLAVLTDSHVHALYTAELVDDLRRLGLFACSIVVPEGEGSKSIDRAMNVISELFAAGIDRRGVILNVGGGMITDVGGFVAATYMRGVAYVNIPTTLLAQLDSAIGGKVAVNVPSAKNFVGAFYHPTAVWSDPKVLASLHRRDLVAGIAEAIKVAIIGSPELFVLLEQERDAIVDRRDPGVLADVVRRAAALKIDLLAPDPHEQDLRRLLNLGHTFAHPLEVELGYGRILHGEAVAHGLALAATVGWRRGLCSIADRDRILALLAQYQLPTEVAPAILLRACERLDAVRLVRGNKLHYVIPAGIGRCEIAEELERNELRDALLQIIDRGGHAHLTAA